MPDTDLMPRGCAIPAAPAPPAGLVDVLARAGRRRRRRQAGAIATTLAACVAVLAVTMAGNGVVDSLGVTPAHTDDRPTGTVTGLTQEPSADQEHAGTSRVVDPGGALSPTAGAAAAVRSGQRNPQPGSGGVAPAPPRRAGSEVGPPHTTTAYDASRGCAGGGPTAAQGWCAYYDGATSGHAGQRVELAAALCRLPGQGNGTLQVDSGQQAAFSARNSDDSSHWTWERGHRFSPYGTTFQVAAGSCIRWHVSWTVVDDAGRPLAAGAYSLVGRSLAYPPGNTQLLNYMDAVVFTVT